MSTYLYDCRKCTNKIITASGEEYCKAIRAHSECITIEGNTGKEYVFRCTGYSLDPEKTVFKEKITDGKET